MSRRYYKKKRMTKAQKEAAERLRWGLEPETQRSILGVALLVIGLVFFLSVLGLGGVLGGALAFGIKFLFGIVAFPLPLLLIIIGGIILSPSAIEFRASAFLGIIFSIVTLSALAHLFVPADSAYKIALEGGGGGMIGFGISTAFLYVFSFWVSLVLLLGGAIVSIMIATDFSLRGLIQKISDWYHAQVSKKSEGSPKKGLFNFPLFGRRSKINNQKEEVETTAPLEPISKDEDWNFPPLSLLEDDDSAPKAGNVQKNCRIIEETLDNFGIEVKMSEVNVGPTVSQYSLKPATGVKLNQITTRLNDIALALAAHPIRIEAPIPGRNAVGIEVPNKVPGIVKLRKILSSSEYKKHKSSLSIILGRDVSGEAKFDNLTEMPHLLIAGATGSGKSVCINSILSTFLYNNSPRDLRLILVDPKRVEFTSYNDIPHLLTPVITDSKETISALKWAISEMERRYDIFQKAQKRNLETYNKTAPKEERLPAIVIVIDELADLMAVAAREIEASIVRLTQMARATGIHMIVATQRPSVDVITGLIKANITHRIAFSVASQADSRTILDRGGADKLLGNGDMLYLDKSSPKPTRIQAILSSDNEINSLTKFLKKQAEARYNDEITQFKGKVPGVPSSGATGDRENKEQDELIEEAAKIVVQHQKGSASLLQRTLSVGYARAARILDELQAIGIVGPSKDSRPREVMVTDESGLDDLLNSKQTLEKPGDDS